MNHVGRKWALNESGQSGPKEPAMFAPIPLCKRRSPIIGTVVIACLVAAFVMLASRLLHGGEIDYRQAATVYVKTSTASGSGVCISPDGLIITAAHVIYRPGPAKLFGQKPIEMPTAVEVTFPGRKPEAARVLAVSRAGEPADLAVLQCTGTDYPILRLAKQSPPVDEKIATLGYPAGHFCWLEGRVTYVGLTTDKGTDAITAVGRTNPGHSGGPLLNTRWEVVGIASAATIDLVTVCGKIETQPQLGFYTRVEQIHALLADRKIPYQLTGDRRPQKRFRPSANQKVRLKIYVQSRQRGKCRFCDKLKDDCDQGKIRIQGRALAECCDITWIIDEEQPGLAAAAGVTAFPHIECVDTGDHWEGYTTADDLLSRVSVKIDIGSKTTSGPPPLFGPLPGESLPPAPTPAPVPEPDPNSKTPADEKKVDESAAEVDVAGVRVIVLLKKQDLGWFDNAVPFIETYARKGFSSKIKSALGDKCEVVLCLERTNRDRYAELMALTGADQEKAVTLIITAPKKFDGAAGYLVGKVEEVVKPLTDRDWKHANIQPVFERLEPDNYEAIAQALDQTEPKGDEVSGSLLGLIASITGAAGIVESFLGHRAKAG